MTGSETPDKHAAPPRPDGRGSPPRNYTMDLDVWKASLNEAGDRVYRLRAEVSVAEREYDNLMQRGIDYAASFLSMDEIGEGHLLGDILHRGDPRTKHGKHVFTPDADNPIGRCIHDIDDGWCDNCLSHGNSLSALKTQAVELFGLPFTPDEFAQGAGSLEVLETLLAYLSGQADAAPAPALA